MTAADGLLPETRAPCNCGFGTDDSALHWVVDATQWLVDGRSCSAFLSEKYENHNSNAAATPNAKPPNSAAAPPEDQTNVAARPQRNPTGRHTQAIRRVRASIAEARNGLCFVRHHIGYRIPMLIPNDATASNIFRGESPIAISVAGNGRNAKTIRPNRVFSRRRCRS